MCSTGGSINNLMIKTSLGIEISGKDLRFALLKASFGKVRLLRVGVVEKFLELEPAERSQKVRDLVQKERLSAPRTYLSLPAQRGIIRQINLPIEVKENLKSAVELQVESLSPWPASEIYWDYGFAAPGKVDKLLRITVAIIPKLELEPWVEFFKAVKLPLAGASLTPVSQAHGIGFLWKDDAPTLVLDCKEDGVEGTLTGRGKLGSAHAKGEETASMVKSVSERLMSVARVGATEITRMLVFGANSAELRQDNPALPLENASKEHVSSFSAIAAALLGIKSSGFSANLVPLELRHRRNHMQLLPTYVLMLVAIGLGFLAVAREPYQMSVYGAQLDTEIKTLAPTVKDLAQQESELDSLTKRHRALFTNFAQRDRNLEALRELTKVLPQTAFITTYSFQDGGVTIAGFSVSASEVQKALEDSPLFKEVQFTSSVTRDTAGTSAGKDRFTLKAAIEVQP